MVERRRRRDGELSYDVVVFGRRDVVASFDPDAGSWIAGWVMDGDDATIPRLRHGYVFGGWREGALLAITHDVPSLERVVDVMTELAAWTREAWDVRSVRQRWLRGPWGERLIRAADVATVALAVVLLRRGR